MEHEKLSYAEAIRYLAKKYGIEIKEDRSVNESKEAQSERDESPVYSHELRERLL